MTNNKKNKKFSNKYNRNAQQDDLYASRSEKNKVQVHSSSSRAKSPESSINRDDLNPQLKEGLRQEAIASSNSTPLNTSFSKVAAVETNNNNLNILSSTRQQEDTMSSEIQFYQDNIWSLYKTYAQKHMSAEDGSAATLKALMYLHLEQNVQSLKSVYNSLRTGDPTAIKLRTSFWESRFSKFRSTPEYETIVTLHNKLWIVSAPIETIQQNLFSKISNNTQNASVSSNTDDQMNNTTSSDVKQNSWQSPLKNDQPLDITSTTMIHDHPFNDQQFEISNPTSADDQQSFNDTQNSINLNRPVKYLATTVLDNIPGRNSRNKLFKVNAMFANYASYTGASIKRYNKEKYIIVSFGNKQDRITAIKQRYTSKINDNFREYFFQNWENIKKVDHESDIQLTKERTIQVIDIPLNFKAKILRLFFSKHGAIDKIHMKTKGLYQTAYITFKDRESVNSFHDNIWSECILGEAVRIMPLKIDFNKRQQRNQHVLKLAGFYHNFNIIDLQEILNSIKAKAIFAPRKINGYKKHNYIYLYFENEEEKNKAIQKQFFFDNHKLFWANSYEKTCFCCGSRDHIYSSCPNNIKTIRHDKINTLYKKFKPAQHKKNNITKNRNINNKSTKHININKYRVNKEFIKLREDMVTFLDKMEQRNEKGKLNSDFSIYKQEFLAKFNTFLNLTSDQLFDIEGAEDMII
jgi:hypothetical protein